MKIGIVTLHRANNYGAVLQAYALQRVLIRNGIDAVIVDYEGEFLKHPFAIENWKVKGVLAQCFTLAGEMSRLPRRIPFKQFRKKLICTESVNNDSIKKLEPEFDLFISGSDQVWNYNITNKDGVYLLDFVKDSNKKGSYAASFGFTEIPENVKQWYKERIAAFKYLNIREKSAIPMVKGLCSREVDIVLDPTLLLTKKDWEEILVYPKMKDKYVLIYQVGMSKDLVGFAEKLAKSKGLKLCSIPFPQGKFAQGKYILNAGPMEWLGWINGAEYVVTDSFHGVALSVVLEKQFFVNHSPLGKKLSSRIDDLLEALNINGRHVDLNTKKLPGKINYNLVNGKMEQLRQNSMDRLLQMVRNENE